MATNLLNVRIISSHEDVFNGSALSVSSVNSAGKFDILPQHAKFITLVENNPIVVRLPDNKVREFRFNLCIIHAHNDQVDIYTNPSESALK